MFFGGSLSPTLTSGLISLQSAYIQPRGILRLPALPPPPALRERAAQKAGSRENLVRYPVSLSPLILRSHKADLRHLTFQIPAYVFAYLDSCLAILNIYLLAKLRPFPEAVEKLYEWRPGSGVSGSPSFLLWEWISDVCSSRFQSRDGRLPRCPGNISSRDVL